MPKIDKKTIETGKTVIIAVLITAIVSFVAGNIYAGNRQTQVNAAVEKAQQPIKK